MLAHVRNCRNKACPTCHKFRERVRQSRAQRQQVSGKEEDNEGDDEEEDEEEGGEDDEDAEEDGDEDDMDKPAAEEKAAKRIQALCLRLLLDAALTQQVKLIIDSARDLLVGRHLDQILMCAVYGVCKVNLRQVTFRQIIEQYKRQPGASPRTFREVRMATAELSP